MKEELLVGLLVVKITALILGGIVSLMAYRAYSRTRIAGLQYFTVGLAIITLGTFSERFSLACSITFAARQSQSGCFSKV